MKCAAVYTNHSEWLWRLQWIYSSWIVTIIFRAQGPVLNSSIKSMCTWWFLYMTQRLVRLSTVKYAEQFSKTISDSSTLLHWASARPLQFDTTKRRVTHSRFCDSQSFCPIRTHRSNFVLLSPGFQQESFQLKDPVSKISNDNHGYLNMNTSWSYLIR